MNTIQQLQHDNPRSGRTHYSVDGVCIKDIATRLHEIVGPQPIVSKMTRHHLLHDMFDPNILSYFISKYGYSNFTFVNNTEPEIYGDEHRGIWAIVTVEDYNAWSDEQKYFWAGIDFGDEHIPQTIPNEEAWNEIKDHFIPMNTLLANSKEHTPQEENYWNKAMTVAELITRLKLHNPDRKVLIEYSDNNIIPLENRKIVCDDVINTPTGIQIIHEDQYKSKDFDEAIIFIR